jgi:hypothetical protein
MTERTFGPADVAPLIHFLVQLIGIEKVSAAVASWRRGVPKADCAERRQYLDQSFPWWSAFEEFWALTQPARPGQVVMASATVLGLAKDAQKLQDLLPGMPATVRSKYAAALSSIDNAPGHFFEIDMAHHFWMSGHSITWCEAAQGQKMPEFIVHTPTFDFEVECKQMSVDKGRSITRADFARLADQVIKRFRAQGLCGTIKVDLLAPLSAKQNGLANLAEAISQLAKTGARTGSHMIAPWGDVTLDIIEADAAVVDFDEMQIQLRARTPLHAHSLISAEGRAPDSPPINPLAMTVACVRPDTFNDAIKRTLYQAAGSQLSGDRPGVLCVFIPEIRDFEALGPENRLERIAGSLFDGADRSHLAGVMYASHGQVVPDGAGSVLMTAPALAFTNSNCRFPELRGFRFFAGGMTSKK